MSDVAIDANGFVVRQPGYQGDLSGLARALRNGSLAPRDLDLLRLVEDALTWFETEAERDLDLASIALPQVAQVVELKVRLLLPRPPRQEELFEEDDEDDASRALAAVALLEELESAMEFLRVRRFERSVMVPVRTPRPELPRPQRPVTTTAERLATLAKNLRPGAYFELAFERLTLEDASRRIRTALRRLTQGRLRALVPTRSWAERTVVFVALLELVREGRVRADQEDAFGDIEVERPSSKRP